MLVSDILLRVRDTLADSNGDRWDDARLIRLVDEAQKTIAMATKCLKTSINMAVHNKQSTYVLPDNSIVVTRVLYNNRVLSTTDSEQLDSVLGVSWGTLSGTPKYLVTDTLNKGLVKLCPIPDNVIESTDLTILTYMTIYYIKISDTLTAVADELELEEMYKTMIVKYVCGYALRDDMDSQNRTFGAEELQIFSSWLKEVTVQISKDNISNNIYLTSYRGGL